MERPVEVQDSKPEAAIPWARWRGRLAQLALLLLIVVCSTLWWQTGTLAAVTALLFQSVLWRHRPRQVMYACSVALLVVALALTVGVQTRTRTASGMVTDVWVDDTSFLFWDAWVVTVTCGEAEVGELMPLLREEDWGAIWAQRVNGQDEVDLTYRLESVLGIWDLKPVADTVNSKLVLAGDSREYRGGLLGRLQFAVTLLLGAAPLAYLVFKDRKRLLSSGRVGGA